MGTIATTGNATPFIYPSTTLLARANATGHLYAMVKASAGNTYTVYRSTDGGANWTSLSSLVRASITEIGSIEVDNRNWLWWAYRTNESSQDRIWFRRMHGVTGDWGPECLLGDPGNGGVAGSVHTGLDIKTIYNSGYHWVAVAVGTHGSAQGVTVYTGKVDGNNTFTRAPEMIAGTSQWIPAAGSGRITPSLDMEHNGDGYESSAPNLWLSFGRDRVHLVKLPWRGGGWTGPTAAVQIRDGFTAQDSITGRWDGQRFLMCVPGSSPNTSAVMLLERNRSNSVTTVRMSPVHPTGVVRNCTLSYNAVNKDVRIYAMGTSTDVLYYIDYIRASDTWSSWAQVTATAILGANNYGVRRGSIGNARHDVYAAHTTPTPNTLVSIHQALTYAPNIPAWDPPAIGVNNGAAADVTQPLNLDWIFSDPDPADAQTAYALSRQIGTGTIQYFRASDSTWQATEQKNLTGTTSRSLAAGWGLTSDAPHTYRVKVWDSSDTASLYSDAFVILPSGKVNPTITSPTEAQVISTGQVTVTWTVAEQTQYRVKLLVLGATLHDSGWRGGTDTSYTIPHELGDGFSYTIQLQTKNAEGLASDVVPRNFSVSFVPPPVATVALTPMPDLGVIRAVVTTPAPVGTQPAVASVNLWRRPFTSPYIRQYDFEDVAEMAEWASPFGGTAARSNAQAHKGSWSYRLTPDGVTFVGLVETIKLPAVAGVEYFLDAWIRGATATKPVWVQLRWFDAADTPLGSSNGFIQDPPAAAGAWEYRWVNGVAPANTARMTLVAVVDLNPGVGDIIDVDEVRVRPTDRATDVRVAVGLPANATFDDWRAVSGVDYEYRAEVRSVNGTTVGGVWTN